MSRRDDALALARAAARHLYKEDPDFVVAGCSDVSEVLAAWLSKRGYAAAPIYGWARRGKQSWFMHAWLEVEGERFDPVLWVQRRPVEKYDYTPKPEVAEALRCDVEQIVEGEIENLDRAFLIDDILAFAKEKGLDLSVTRKDVSPWEIEVEERLDVSVLRSLIRAIRRAGGRWPEDFPLPVVVRGRTMTLLDGTHRTVAARHEELPTIPVLTVDSGAYWAIKEAFDMPAFDFVRRLLPRVSRLAAENVEKDVDGGREKDRTLEAFDVAPGSMEDVDG